MANLRQFYAKLALEFNEFHRSDLNIALHLLTTPLFYVAVSSLLLHLLPTIQGLVVLNAIYVISMFPFLNSPILYFATALSTALTLMAAISANLTLVQSWILFGLAYFAQDVAHWITGEPTFQSAYQQKLGLGPGFLVKLIAHTYFMLPLVLHSAWAGNVMSELLSWFCVRERVFRVKLDSKNDVGDLKTVEDWMDSLDIKDDVTTHYWFSELPQHIKLAFQRVSISPKIMGAFGDFFTAPIYKTRVLESMNEVYIAASADTKKVTSDNVFYSNHIDGPFFCFPFCSVYRSIFAVNTNKAIKTIFTALPERMGLTNGDVAAFDFNREIHRIERDEVDGPQVRRYCLKVHYLVYPAALPFYGDILAYATSSYDTLARLAFLKTLEPKGLIDRALWVFIMLCTWSFFTAVNMLGNTGVCSYLLGVGSVSLVFAAIPKLGVDPHTFFVVCTSFVHYMIYIATYYHQKTKSCAFEAFKRTVMAYKCIAFINLFYFYLSNFTFDILSLAMICTGFGISLSALLAIGVDATYFGVELGKMKWGKRVTSFPYNIIQHPMIVGNCLGLLGFMKMPGFFAAAPWLVPCHVTFYIGHMLQEHHEFYATAAAPRCKKDAVMKEE